MGNEQVNPIPYKKFKKLDEDRQRELLTDWLGRYPKGALAKEMAISYNTLTTNMKRLGLDEFLGYTEQSYRSAKDVKTGIVAETTKEVDVDKEEDAYAILAEAVPSIDLSVVSGEVDKELDNLNVAFRIVNIEQLRKMPEDRQAYLLKYWSNKYSYLEILTGLGVEAEEYIALTTKLGVKTSLPVVGEKATECKTDDVKDLVSYETWTSYPEEERIKKFRVWQRMHTPSTIMKGMGIDENTYVGIVTDLNSGRAVDRAKAEKAEKLVEISSAKSLVKVDVPAIEIYVKDKLPNILDKDKVKLAGYSAQVILICRDADNVSEFDRLASFYTGAKVVRGFGSGFLYAIVYKEVN